MRDRYWSLFYKLKFQSFYYKRFQIFFFRINWFITAFCSIVSLSCIAAWNVWTNHPAIWSLLICTSQIVQALFPKLPYNDLLVSTKFMLCSIDRLLIQMEYDWLSIDLYQYDDKKILELVSKYETEYSALVSQFYSGTFLPEIKCCFKKAEKECNTFFQVNFSA